MTDDERLRRGGGDGPRRAGERARPEVEVRGEQRRVARSQPAVQRPRVAAERRREAAREVRLVDLALGDRLADRLDARLVRRAIQARAELEPVDARRRRRRRRRRRGREQRARGPRLEAPVEARDPLVDRPPAEPGRPVAPIPGDDPVVEREAHRPAAPGPRPRSTAAARSGARGRSRGTRRGRRGTAAVGRGARATTSVHRRASSRRAFAKASGPSDGASRTATGSAVRYVQRAFRPGPRALEQHQARQVAEPLRDVHRRERVELGQPIEPNARARRALCRVDLVGRACAGSYRPPSRPCLPRRYYGSVVSAR